MIKHAFTLFLICCMTMLFADRALAATETLDQIVAVVNDDVITRSELNTALVRIKMQINQDHIAAPTGDTLKKQVLDQLVNKKLQLQMARQMGIEISDAELNHAIESVAKQNQTTVNDLYQRLGKEHLSVAEYRHEIRDQMTLQKLQQQEVAGKINVTPDEVKSFMRTHIKHISSNTKEYRVEDILISLSDAPSPEEIAAAQHKAETLLAKLNAGQSLRSLLQTETATLNDLGFRKLAAIPSAFTDAVTQLQLNQFAGPIQTQNGFHIIHLANVRTLKDAKTEKPNLKQVEDLLLQQKFEEAVQHWISKLRNQAYIVMNPDRHDRS